MNDTVTIDRQLYDRQAVYEWLSAYDLPADCVPLDGVRNLDRDAGTVEVRFMAHDKQGKPIIDRQHKAFMLTEWMEGRYSVSPPEPLYEPEPAA